MAEEKKPKVYMVNQGELAEVGAWPPVFSVGDAYIVDTGAVIYIWLGKDCSTDEKGTAAVEAQKMDKDRKGIAKIVTYDQGDEGHDLMKLISGVRIVHKNLAKSFLIDVSTGTYAGHMDHVDALYRVDSEAFDDINEIKLLQVPLKKESLDSEDSFIADMGDEILVWNGKECNAKERMMAGKFARKFDADRAGAQNVIIVDEGDSKEQEFIAKVFEGKKVVKSHQLPTDQPEADISTSEPAPEPAAPEPGPEPVKKSEPAPAPEPTRESADDAEMKVVNGIIEVTHEGRRQCPKCGCVKPHMIKEFTDRTKIINPYPVIYGKKYKCGQCGCEWRYTA